MQSETIGKLAEALSKAQGAMLPAKRDAENPFFKSKYADLAAVWKAARDPLATNGLSVIQTTEFVDGDSFIVTTLAHSSGEWIRGRYRVKAVKDDPQSLGSAVTYARRYAFCGIVGVAADDDDDGNGASGRSEKGHGDQKPASPFATEGDRIIFCENLVRSFNSATSIAGLQELWDLSNEKLSFLQHSAVAAEKSAHADVTDAYKAAARAIKQATKPATVEQAMGAGQ